MSAQYRILDWDSRWFGFPIGRADLPALTGSAIAEVDAWARAEGLMCVYLFTQTMPDPHQLPAELQPIDNRIEYELDPQLRIAGTTDEVTAMRREEQEQVYALARRLFTSTRFSRDKGFPPDRVKALYEEWVRKDCTQGVPGCLVSRLNHDIRGFVTGHMDPADATRGSIGLLGVAEAHRGDGVGSRLLDQVCRAFAECGARRISVATQAANEAACRLYERRGRVIARGFWYHRWYPVMSTGEQAP